MQKYSKRILSLSESATIAVASLAVSWLATFFVRNQPLAG